MENACEIDSPYENEKWRTFGTHAQVDGLDHVNESLVLLILDVSTPPTCRTRGLGGDLG